VKRTRSRRLRLAIGFVLTGIAALWGTVMIALYVGQTKYVTVQARVTAKSCYHVNSGGGYELADSTACNLTVSYVAPDGAPNVALLPGVDKNRIRRAPDGSETLLIYFADRRSEIPINPQDYVPLWAVIVLGTVGVAMPGVLGAFLLRTGFRRRAIPEDQIPRANAEP
jgi:hypothetical protein